VSKTDFGLVKMCNGYYWFNIPENKNEYLSFGKLCNQMLKELKELKEIMSGGEKNAVKNSRNDLSVKRP
jgi:hypothetical protein